MSIDGYTYICITHSIAIHLSPAESYTRTGVDIYRAISFFIIIIIISFRFRS